MAIGTLEERLEVLEREMTQVKARLGGETQPASHPWDKVFGSFATSEGFDEAIRLGREYRESLYPDEEEEDAT